MIKRIKRDRLLRRPVQLSFYWRMLAAYLLILLVPVTFMETVNFLSVRASTLESFNGIFDSEGKKQVNSMEEQLLVMRKVTADAKNTSFFYQPFSEKNYPGAVLDIRTYLNDQSPWLTFFSGVYYYNKEEGKGLSSYGMMSDKTFFSQNLQSDTDISMDQIHDNEFAFFDTFNQNTREEQIAVITPLEKDVSYLIFTLDKKMLSNTLSIPGLNGPVSVSLYYKDQLVYLNDHESDISSKETYLSYRVAGSFFQLEWRIPKSIYIGAIFQSIWKQFVVVLFVLAGGFGMIELFMKQNYLPLKQMVRNLAEKFPHKDEIREVGDEVKYLDWMMGELLYSQQFLEESNQELKKEQLLYQLFCSHIQKGSVLYEECISSGIQVDNRSFLCLFLEEENNDGCYHYLTEGLKQERNDMAVYSTNFTENGFLFLITSDMECGDLEAFIKEKINPVGLGKVVFGKAVDQVDQIYDSYQSLNEAENQSENITALQQEKWEAIYPRTSLMALKEAAEGEQLAKMGLAVSGIKEAMEKLPLSAALIVYLEAVELITGERQEPSSILTMLQGTETPKNDLIEEILGLYKKFRVESVLTTVPGAAISPMGRWQRDINEILNYIEGHCTDHTFSIKAMASEIGTTPSNLSHYFKKCTGQNISRYIDTVKMKRAMEMLKKQELVSDTAEKLGYNSTSVFIETFKRICGTTPAQYRQEITGL